MIVDMRRKPTCVLKANIQELPYSIGRWKRIGHHEQVARATRILVECRAELDRRERRKKAPAATAAAPR